MPALSVCAALACWFQPHAEHDLHCQVPIRCPVHYITIPILETRSLKRALGADRCDAEGAATARGAGKGKGKGRAKARARGRGRGRAFKKKRRLTVAVKKTLTQQIVWRKWPILRPLSMASCLLQAGAGSMLCLGLTQWTDVLFLAAVNVQC